RAGVPLVTRRGQQALDRDCPHLQALGCAPWGMPGRDFLRVLPLLLTMEGAVHAQLFHGWSKVFPLKRQSDDLTVGVKHGDACRYRYQNVHREVEEVEQFFVSSHMKNAIVQEAIAFKENLKGVFVISRKIVNTAIGRDVREALANYALPVLEAAICQRVAFAESAAQGLTVLETDA